MTSINKLNQTKMIITPNLICKLIPRANRIEDVSNVTVTNHKKLHGIVISTFPRTLAKLYTTILYINLI